MESWEQEDEIFAFEASVKGDGLTVINRTNTLDFSIVGWFQGMYIDLDATLNPKEVRSLHLALATWLVKQKAK